MFNSFLRGVLLPLIFLIPFSIYAEKSIDDLFEVFYSDIKDYSAWVKSDRNNTFKDVFINLYNLPAKKKRKYSNDVEIKILEGFSDNEVQNAYTYLEFQNRTSVDFVIWGVKKGTVKINGAERGTVEVDHDTGFALLKCVFEKGVYFVTLKIKERFTGVPVKILSNKKTKVSKRGFNRKASCSAKIYNIKARYPDTDISSLYRGFCFPYGNERARETFYALSLKEDFPDNSRASLFYYLYSLTVNLRNESELRKTGFNKKQMEWWKKRLFEKEVCRYE